MYFDFEPWQSDETWVHYMQEEGKTVNVQMKLSSDYVVVEYSATRSCKHHSHGKTSERSKLVGSYDARCFPEIYCPVLLTVLKH